MVRDARSACPRHEVMAARTVTCAAHWRRFMSKTSDHVRLRPLRPHAGALHRRREAGRHRPQFPRHRPSARDLRPHAEHLEFEACEMSSSEFIRHAAHGDCPMVAIPVFPSRVFRHGYHRGRQAPVIKEPKDLAGKRIGVPLYAMTAAIFIRGLLQHDYGVDLSGVHLGRGRHERHQAARQRRPACRWCARSRIEPHTTAHVAERPARVRRHRRHHQLGPAEGDQDAIRTSSGCFPTTASARSTTTGAPRSSRSCISW